MRNKERALLYRGVYVMGKRHRKVSVAGDYVASVSRKLNDAREFCNVTPPPPSLYSVVPHCGEALIHMP